MVTAWLRYRTDSLDARSRRWGARRRTESVNWKPRIRRWEPSRTDWSRRWTRSCKNCRRSWTQRWVLSSRLLPTANCLKERSTGMKYRMLPSRTIEEWTYLLTYLQYGDVTPTRRCCQLLLLATQSSTPQHQNVSCWTAESWRMVGMIVCWILLLIVLIINHFSL